MNNLKYTDLLKEPRKTEPIKKTELLNIPRAVSFVPPNYIGALDADGNLGGERTVSNTTTNTTQPTYREALGVRNLNGTVVAVNKDGNVGGVRPGIPLLEKGGTGSGVVEGNPTTDNGGSTDVEKVEGGETIVETQPMSYEEYILSLKSKADDTYKRSIINAQNTYDHSRSAYGENAAALGNMGLTGSGYSQYLDSKAYAQRSADMNAAGAVRADAYANADAKYMDYLNQKETEAKNEALQKETEAKNEALQKETNAKNEALQKETNAKNAYMSLYEALTKDPTTYSSADIDRLGAQMGLTPEQISGLKDVRGEQVVKYLDNNDYSKETLDQLFPEGGDLYQNYLNKLITDATDTVSADMFKGYDQATSSPMYNSVKNLIESQIANTEEGSEERASLEKTLETLNNAYNSAYNNPLSVSSNIKFNANNINAKNFADGDRFTITDGTNKYVVDGAGEADENVKTLASNNSIEDGAVFKYGGDYYIRVGDNYYKFKARSSQSDDWQAFTKAFNDEITSKAED